MFFKAYLTPEWKPLTGDDLEDLRTECVLSNLNLPSNQTEKCIRKCALEKSGMFDETNGLNVENIIKMEIQDGRSESAARSRAEKCAVKKEESETFCDWASRALDCLVAEIFNEQNVKRSEN